MTDPSMTGGTMTVSRFSLVHAFMFGLGFAVGVIGLVIGSGQTFGQRCAKAYASPVEQESCVIRLSKGGRVYRTEEP